MRILLRPSGFFFVKYWRRTQLNNNKGWTRKVLLIALKTFNLPTNEGSEFSGSFDAVQKEDKNRRHENKHIKTLRSMSCISMLNVVKTLSVSSGRWIFVINFFVINFVSRMINSFHATLSALDSEIVKRILKSTSLVTIKWYIHEVM